MDCDTCGRHRPSADISPWREAGGRIVMACGRCRRGAAGRRVEETSDGAPAWPPIVRPISEVSVA